MNRLLLAAAFSCFALPASALPITYQYNQNGQSVPGLAIHAFITIDGTFANLPSLTCAPCPDGTVLNINLLNGLIHYDVDGIGACGITGTCVTSGTFWPVVPVATPEPTTWLLLLTGLAAIGVAHRRRNGHA